MINKGINVLSFFDGISAGQEALRQLNVPVANYISIEIDEKAKQVTKHNFANTTFYGDINEIMDNDAFYNNLPKIDLIFAGSPCQGFSKGGSKKGLDDPRSALFYVFVQILDQLRKRQNNPHIPFFFENVVMDDYWEDIITRNLGGHAAVRIQASEYSATSRDRLYWTNMGIPKWIISKYQSNEVYQDILVTQKPSLDRITLIKDPYVRKISKQNLLKVVQKYKDMVPSKKKQFLRKLEIRHTKPVANEINRIASGIVNTSKISAHIYIPVINNIYWRQQLSSFAMAGIRYEQSHGWRVNRLDRKLPCFITHSVGFDDGLNVVGFPISKFDKRNIEKLGGKTHKPITLEPPKEVKKRLSLKATEYVACHVMTEEALIAMGFPKTYLDIHKLTRSEKIKMIGNSWSVTVVKLIIDHSCHHRGWVR
jgi:site-specific DNA-cytosine methylase